MRINDPEVVAELQALYPEFERRVQGRTVHGRQSQVWAGLPEGLRIVAAHVSLLPESAAD